VKGLIFQALLLQPFQDIAEQTAAKNALENAADLLAERLLPKLAK